MAGIEGLTDPEFRSAFGRADIAPVVPKDVADAWNSIESNAVVGVALDMSFDDGAGTEILKRLSLSRRLFPCVILSDQGYPIGELPSLGRAKMLTNPVPPDILVTALETLMRKK